MSFLTECFQPIKKTTFDERIKKLIDARAEASVKPHETVTDSQPPPPALLYVKSDMGHLIFTDKNNKECKYVDLYSIILKDIIRKTVVPEGSTFGIATYSSKNSIKRKEYIINGNLITVDFTQLA